VKTTSETIETELGSKAPFRRPVDGLSTTADVNQGKSRQKKLKKLTLIHPRPSGSWQHTGPLCLDNPLGLANLNLILRKRCY
jgi:hypothetical protein